MAKSSGTKYVLITVNMLLAFVVSILGNKVAEITSLSMFSLIILLLITLFLCALGLVEYENYLKTGNIRQSLIIGSGRWFLKKTNSKIYTISGPQLEIYSIFCLSVSILIFLSLISYNANDIPGKVSSAQIHNWLGHVGAYIADFLFQKMGWSAFFVPIVLIAFGWLIFNASSNRLRNSSIKAIDRKKRV
ncbi:MAG: DNA translocase FtsK 4TM domain-containing protein [Pyrinomonadaceae bacterium]